METTVTRSLGKYYKRLTDLYLNDLAFYSRPSKNAFLAQRVTQLRKVMLEVGLKAYIVPNEGDHLEEFTADADKRVEYLTGYTGIIGDAVVTENKALLWTDPLLCVRADKEVEAIWTLMEDGEDKSISEWLCQNLRRGSKVGVDARKMSFEKWIELKNALATKEIRLELSDENLVDLIWNDRPSYPIEPIVIYDINFSGELVIDKLKRLRAKMEATETDMFVTAALDEIAWLTNLRGKELPNSPLFISYLLVGEDWASLYIHEEKICSLITRHLSDVDAIIKINPYQKFWYDFEIRLKVAKKVLLPTGISCAIHSKVASKKIPIHRSLSPLLCMKSLKNNTEVMGARNAHLRDAVTFCKLLYILEEQVPAREHWTEFKVSETLDAMRTKQKWVRGPAFETIAAFGKNGAIAFYTPNMIGSEKIDCNSMLTIEAGAQYLDGTTDVTRTLHFGEPTVEERTIYTCIVQGLADIASTVFPDGTKASSLDMLIRRPLLKLGLTFDHNTTHGVGAYLNVNEGFNGIYHPNFIGTHDAGYYRVNTFGMRLTNMYVVVPAKVQNDENAKDLLEFSPLTLIPFEKELIDINLMDKSQIQWLNDYHDLVKLHVGSEMVKQSEHELYKWLLKKTAPLSNWSK